MRTQAWVVALATVLVTGCATADPNMGASGKPEAVFSTEVPTAVLGRIAAACADRGFTIDQPAANTVICRAGDIHADGDFRATALYEKDGVEFRFTGVTLGGDTLVQETTTMLFTPWLSGSQQAIPANRSGWARYNAQVVAFLEGLGGQGRVAAR